jgi:hypothetical protein
MAPIPVEENAAKAKQAANYEQEACLMIVFGKTAGLS